MENKVEIIDEWLNETITEVKDSNWLYKFICFFLGKRKKKMSYKEMYLFIYGLNRSTLGEEKAKEMAMLRIIQIYKDLHNNKLPNGVKK